MTPDRRLFEAQELRRLGPFGAVLGAYTLHSRYDPKETTKPARAAFIRRFYEATPSDLPEAERQRRAEAALKAHMTRLALASARARRRAE